MAPEGAVAKITGKEGTRFTGPARVFHSEEDALEAILGGIVVPGDVLVIRYEGPKGGPGALKTTKKLQTHNSRTEFRKS